MAKLYDLHVKAPAHLISPILELLDGSEGCVVSFDKEAEESKVQYRYAGGKRIKGISGCNAAVLALYKHSPNGGEVLLSKIGSFIAKQFHFAETSASGGLKVALDAGYAAKGEQLGTWKLTEKGIEKAKEISGTGV